MEQMTMKLEALLLPPKKLNMPVNHEKCMRVLQPHKSYLVKKFIQQMFRVSDLVVTDVFDRKQ